MDYSLMIDLIKKYKLFIFFAVIIIIVFLISLFFFLFGGNNKNETLASLPSIASVTPSINASNVILFSKISVSFSSPLSEEQKKQITLLLNPLTDSSTEWSTDNKSFSLIPTTPLAPDKRYTATIQYFSDNYSWNFSTLPLEEVSTEDQIKAQEAADRDFAERDRINQENYPWYNNLPLQAATYFVFFDLNTKKFTAKIYPPSSSPTENEITAIENEVKSRLSSLDIDLNKYTIDWEVTPAP